MRSGILRFFALAIVILSGLWPQLASGVVINSQWNAANGNWGTPANWLPNTSAPDNGVDTYTVQIGNIAANAQVTFVPVSGSNDTVTSLTMSNNADLFTNGNQLNVLTQTTIDGTGSTIRVDPHAVPGTPAFQTIELDLTNGGALVMAGGVATVNGQLEVLTAVLSGRGTINLGNFDAAVEQAFDNSGLIQVMGTQFTPGMLTLHANGVDVIDLDGDSETGVVDVANVDADLELDTMTLVVDGPLADAFGGLVGAAIQIGQRDTITFNQDFQISTGAAVDMNGGNNVATLNGAGDITSITGTTFTIAGNAVINNDMTFVGLANTVTLAANSSLTLGGAVEIYDASAFSFGLNSQLVVSGLMVLEEVAGDFDWDGASGVVTTTVQGTGSFGMAVNHIDAGNDTFNGTINLNDSGDLSVNVTAASWTMGGTLNKSNTGLSAVTGDGVNVTGAVTVNAGTLNMPLTTLSPGATLTVNGTLMLAASSVFAGPTSVVGTGTLTLVNSSVVTASTTIGTNTFDWDGALAGSLHTINNGVIFTVNSPNLDSDGDMDDPISLGGNGATLNVSGPGSWTMNNTLTANSAMAGTATVAGTSRFVMNGTMNVDGNTIVTAPATFAAAAAVAIDAGMTLNLNGGDNSTAVYNRIEGGSFNGPGILAAITGKSLHGFGTINAQIDFDGTSNVRADDGTLNITAAVIDVNQIGTQDSDGILNVTNAWNSNVANSVILQGGELRGGVITIGNASGISGRGLVSARVINNESISATASTLVVDTALDDNDWDGAGNDGMLAASSGATLELRDSGAAFGFTGAVSATGGGRVFTNGFALDFNPGSTLSMTGGVYESTSSTDIGGAVTVNVGAPSKIKVENNFFLTFEPGSTTTLNANLRLENNNINIEPGATFSGAGAIVIPDGSHLVADNLANIGVLLDMQGALRPGNSEGIGRVNLFDYQQADTGELYLELTGTALNAFDRLVTSGDVAVDGYLNIDIDLGFVPALGNTFNIITGNTVTGQFDYVDMADMPSGLTFHINYLGNAVQLQVVNKPIYAADFDDDGDVDITDYSIWRHAYHLNQLGDADGDNDSDAADFVLWRNQLGFVPGAGASLPEYGAVPEPAALAVSLMGLFALVVIGGRRSQRQSPRT